jgi:hypothetical protein
MRKRADSVDVVRGMALTEAAAGNSGKALRAEIRDNADEMRLRLRLFVDQQWTVVTMDNSDVDHVLEDSGARVRIQQRIRAALAAMSAP